MENNMCYVWVVEWQTICTMFVFTLGADSIPVGSLAYREFYYRNAFLGPSGSGKNYRHHLVHGH